MVHNVILNFCANLVPPTRIGWPSSIPTLLPTLLPSSAHRILKIHRVSLSVSPCRIFRQGQAPLRRRRLPHRHGDESTIHDFPPLCAPCCLAKMQKLQRWCLRLVFCLRQQPQRMPDRLCGLLAGRLTGQLTSQITAAETVVIATTCSEVPKPESRHETLCAHVVAQVCAGARVFSRYSIRIVSGCRCRGAWGQFSLSLHPPPPSLSLPSSPSSLPPPPLSLSWRP